MSLKIKNNALMFKEIQWSLSNQEKGLEQQLRLIPSVEKHLFKGGADVNSRLEKAILYTKMKSELERAKEAFENDLPKEAISHIEEAFYLQKEKEIVEKVVFGKTTNDCTFKEKAVFYSAQKSDQIRAIDQGLAYFNSHWINRVFSDLVERLPSPLSVAGYTKIRWELERAKEAVKNGILDKAFFHMGRASCLQKWNIIIAPEAFERAVGDLQTSEQKVGGCQVIDEAIQYLNPHCQSDERILNEWVEGWEMRLQLERPIRIG
jgi:hypothetical protein